MCRLFGLTAGATPVAATFWLLDASDSLVRQSRHNPDGTGLGTFDAAGAPLVEKQPLAAYADDAFTREARERRSSTFVAHVRHSSGTAHTWANTHPFERDGMVFAHNGVVRGLDALEAELGADLAGVAGDTDSERVLALVSREIARADGDVERGVRAALTWVAAHLPVFAVNCVLTGPRDLWASRYPATHDLWVLERHRPDGALHQTSAAGMRVHSAELADAPSVVVASERLDADPRWRMLAPDTLLHVDAGLAVHESVLVGAPPSHPLTLADLGAAAQSQRVA
ncbi:class II glutamine amidotransferase [Miniimonas sp. S16]|uniref:class II glutamine amidotransferase n=1 Tax=Miniimonas sp. S16 TaxID=2171623 RepID=UPI000D527DF4|nr:class II glutamine amidotransferase [Miniimonas sp. S16]